MSIIEPIKFYAACVRRAFAGWFGKISGWAGTIALMIGVAQLLFVLPPDLQQITSQAEPAFFLLAFPIFLATRLGLAPYWIFRDERVSRDKAAEARRPKMVVELPNPPVLNSLSLGGSTSETLGGTRQTIINRWEMDVISLTCRNDGEVTLEGCRARLISAARIETDGSTDLGVIEAIALPWNQHDPEGSHEVDIPASETRRVWLGGVRPKGHIWIFRDIKALPLDYQHLLGVPGTYRVLIQIDAKNAPPQQILLELTTAEGPKVENGFQRGVVEVKVIAQGTQLAITAGNRVSQAA